MPLELRDQRVVPEVMSAGSFEYSARAVRGEAADLEDGFITPEGMFLPYLVSKQDKNIQTTFQQRDRQAEALSGILQGLEIQNIQGHKEILNITKDEIRDLPYRLKEAINSGQLKGLSIVADGMKGDREGDFASSIAIVVAADFILKESRNGRKVNEDFIRTAILRADKVISVLNIGRSGYKKLGVSMSVALTSSEGVTFVGGVGDSRVYLLQKEGNCVLVTDDNTEFWQEEIIQKGTFSPGAMMFKHLLGEYARKLTLKVGDDRVKPDDIVVGSGVLRAGDRLIITTEGVWRGIDDKANQDTINTINGTFTEQIAQRPNENRVVIAQETFGRIFQECNLKGIEFNASAGDIVKHLTREEIDRYTDKNYTAVVIEGR
jgi:protein phosphatase